MTFCGISQAHGPQVLQMNYFEATWADCHRFARFIDGLPDVICREKVGVPVKRIVMQKLACYATCPWIWCVWYYGCELLSESTGYFILLLSLLSIVSNRLVWGMDAEFLTGCCTGRSPSTNASSFFKLLEYLLIPYFERTLYIDPRQICFRPNTNCQAGISNMQEIIKCYSERGSDVHYAMND